MIRDYIENREAVLVASVLAFVVNQADQIGISIDGQAYLWLSAGLTAAIAWFARSRVWSAATLDADEAEFDELES